MKIRKYQKKDDKGIKKLISEVLTEIFNVPPSKESLNDLDNIKKNFEIFFVAEDKGKVIGTIGLKKGEIGKRMYVNKNYRGKGLGQRLYNKMEKYVKGKGVKKISLTTTPQMKDAIRFYKKNGFKKVKENKKLNQLFFEKTIK